MDARCRRYAVAVGDPAKVGLIKKLRSLGLGSK
jgi:hypothetical protein